MNVKTYQDKRISYLFPYPVTAEKFKIHATEEPPDPFFCPAGSRKTFHR